MFPAIPRRSRTDYSPYYYILYSPSLPSRPQWHAGRWRTPAAYAPFAGYRIGLFYVAVDKQVGGGAAAAAIEAGEAVLTFVLCVHIAHLELVPDLSVHNARVHISQQELFISHN